MHTTFPPNPVQEAQDLLASFWDIPTNGLPVDISSVATHLGIQIFQVNFSPETEALLFLAPSGYPQIFIENNVSTQKKRFLIAYEIGQWIYFLRTASSKDTDPLRLIHKQQISPAPPSQAENFAHQFTQEILVPSNALSTLKKSYPSDIALASLFNVPLSLIAP